MMSIDVRHPVVTDNDGVLVCGFPGVGKTTLVRVSEYLVYKSK